MNDYNDGIIPEPCLRLDYGFGQEYASVELGDGTGYVRVTDDLRGEYHKMQRWYDDVLKGALDSNDELRLRNASLEAALEGMHLIREQDKDENDKLRELVRSVLVLRHDRVFKWLDAAMAEVFGTSFTAQARELGVEVDDAREQS